MAVRLNTAASTSPLSRPRAMTAEVAAQIAHSDGFDGAVPLNLARAESSAPLAPRGLGFETREVSSAAAHSATPAYDAAADLFPGLDWLDPAKYQTADPSKLPAQQASEVQHMLDAQATRTPEQTAIALDLAHRGVFSLWMNYADQYAQTHGLLKGAVLKAKLALALGADGIADGVKKLEVNEPRPFQVDPRIEKLGGTPTGSSYPSGHSASAYAAATVLAEAMPDRASEFYAAAANVARSRVYLGVHFPGDVAAGAQLGMKVGDDF